MPWMGKLRLRRRQSHVQGYTADKKPTQVWLILKYPLKLSHVGFRFLPG